MYNTQFTIAMLRIMAKLKQSELQFRTGTLSLNSKIQIVDVINSLFHSNIINNAVYPGDLEIKDTTESASSVLNLYILPEKDTHGNPTTKLYD